MTRSICIHGHFYQPPRENAWLEEVELQDSAYPYHDWNERVSAECYAPNSASRVLDEQGLIVDIVNNYARISFDIGPTLLAWMEKSRPDIYQAILEADRESRKRHGGHGGAIAQAYNHIILPLANSRDKRTQVLWGIADFESRFGRKPEGMWLPETAVDLESLDILAGQGIRFTILSPYQAARVRTKGARDWQDAGQGKIDPRRPYLCHLPTGRTIALFFYDGPLAHDVAFGDLLQNGGRFAQRLIAAFAPGPAEDELIHIATDGESYGHHHRFGDMALAFGLNFLEANKLADLTVCGEYLERHPPTDEVEIVENSSWSCAHGVERWRNDCGDNSGAHSGWNQKWRTPLREAMDWLRDKAAAAFEDGLQPLTSDPWRARDDYIRVILDRSSATVEAFLRGHINRPLDAEDKTRLLKLLEAERQALLMFTSDGWFFDDISNIETVQVIQHAARAIQLVREVSAMDLEPGFVAFLEKARSNRTEQENGARVYERLVKPAVFGFPRLAAHYAVTSLFKESLEKAGIAHYEAQAETCWKEVRAGRRAAVGRVRLKSEITREEQTLTYAVVYLGGQELAAGVKTFDDRERLNEICRAMKQVMTEPDYAGVLRLLDREFGTSVYSLSHLCPDERRSVVKEILESSLLELEAVFRRTFESNAPIMKAMTELRILLPQALSTLAECVLNADFRRALTRNDLDFSELEKLVAEFEFWSFAPDPLTANALAARTIDSLMARWAERPDDPAALASVERLFALFLRLKMELDLWKSQNIYFSRGKEAWRENAERAAKGEIKAQQWQEHFAAVGRRLRFSPDIFKEGKRTQVPGT